MVDRRDQESEQSKSPQQSTDFGDTQVFDMEELQRERRLMSLLLKERYRQRYENQDIDPDYFDEEFATQAREESIEYDQSDYPTDSNESDWVEELEEEMDPREQLVSAPEESYYQDQQVENIDQYSESEITSTDIEEEYNESEQESTEEEGDSWFADMSDRAGKQWGALKDKVAATFTKSSDSDKQTEDTDKMSDTQPIDADQVKEMMQKDLEDPDTMDDEAEETVVSEMVEMDHRVAEDIPIPPTEFEETDWEDEPETSEEAADGVVSGAAWLSAGSIISRILGAIYVIPWAAWLGAEFTSANSLYSIGYKPYSLFLAIATAGFPSAIAKLMAYFHSKDEYRVADKIFKYSSLVMLITGLISGGLLFGLAPSMAAATATTDVAGATLVIRSLVPALLILPFMSLLRGYFQGFNDMKPTAVSQIIEQFVRVIYILGATYLIMQVYNGSATNAVVQSTFAAFVGALASLIYLVVLYIKHLPQIRARIETSRDEITIDFAESIKLMITDSIPFVLLGSGIIIAQLVDTFTFRQILESRSSLLLSEIEQLYGALSLDVDKLMMIIISLAVALATSAVPAVTRLFSRGDIEGTSRLVERIVSVFAFFMIPAALGMATISTDVYNFFYLEGISIGPQLLITGSISSVALGAYTVLSTVLQAMSFRRIAIRYLLVALLIKAVLQYPLVALLHAHGALLSTMIGFAVASLLMWRTIKQQLNLNMQKLKKQLLTILLATVLMIVVTLLWHIALGRIFGPTGRLLTLVKIIIEVAVAVFMYGFVMGVCGELSIILDDRYQELQDKIRMF